jgi:hypothetical protein
LGGKVVNCLPTLVHQLLAAQPTLDTSFEFFGERKKGEELEQVRSVNFYNSPITAHSTRDREKKILLLLPTSRGPFTTFFFFQIS